MSSKTWAVVSVSAVALIAAAVMAIMHVDKDVIILILGVSVTPVLTSFLSAQQGEANGTIKSLQLQTNGNWSRALDIMDRQGQMLAQGVPAAAIAPTSPAAPAPVPAAVAPVAPPAAPSPILTPTGPVA